MMFVVGIVASYIENDVYLVMIGNKLAEEELRILYISKREKE